ncbi:MAG: hypothetical protein N3A38_08825 [Planctomycetota bacterium]|nr:hypothetical protein [Planctomycetota bacterium]
MVAPPNAPRPPPPPAAPLTGADLFGIIVFVIVFVLVLGAVAILLEHKLPGAGTFVKLAGWIALAVWWAFRSPHPDGFDIKRAIFVMLFGLPFVVGFVYFARYALAHSPLVLSEEVREAAVPGGSECTWDCRSMVGRSGTALSPLRPVGRVRIGEDIVDAVSGSGWIEEGAEVTVTRDAGGEIIVIERKPGAQAPEPDPGGGAGSEES